VSDFTPEVQRVIRARQVDIARLAKLRDQAERRKDAAKAIHIQRRIDHLVGLNLIGRGPSPYTRFGSDGRKREAIPLWL